MVAGISVGVLVQPSEHARRVERVDTDLFGDPAAPAYPHHFDSADYLRDEAFCK